VSRALVSRSRPFDGLERLRHSPINPLLEEGRALEAPEHGVGIDLASEDRLSIEVFFTGG